MTDRSTMRAEAVEAMARAAYESHNGDFAVPADDWDTAPGIVKASKRQEAQAAYDRLFSPQTVSCSECQGGTIVVTEGPMTGTEMHPPTGRVKPCPAGCDHGQISSPPLAVLMGELEQVGWRREDPTPHYTAMSESYPHRDGETWVPLYVRSGEDT